MTDIVDSNLKGDKMSQREENCTIFEQQFTTDTFDTIWLQVMSPFCMYGLIDINKDYIVSICVSTCEMESRSDQKIVSMYELNY